MRSPGRFPRSVFSKIASLAREVRRAPRAANLSQELELQPPEPLSSRIPERDHWDITERWEKDAALLIINALDRAVCSGASPVPGPCRTRQAERGKDVLSPRAMGEFLIRLIDEWGLNTPHIVAPDVGTSAALFAAALHPGKLRSLVIGSGATAYPLQVGGVLKDIIDAPDLEAFRAIDPRVTLGASLDKGHEHYRLPTEVREDYLKSYEGGRFAESTRYVRSYPQELPVLGELLPGKGVPEDSCAH